MSLQAFYALFSPRPGFWLNLLALFLASAGAWLLLATRQRELQAVGSLAMDNAGSPMTHSEDEPTQRLNRFFYQFGFSCLACGLLLSWLSTQW